MLLAVFIVVVLVRADKSLANGALVLIALIAVVAAAVAYVRPLAGARSVAVAEQPPPSPPPMSLAAMACLDGLAGDAVEAACEHPLFASAESSAAAVSYTAAQLSRLAAASPDKKLTSEMVALRRAVERDRYGLVAHVLSARDGCTPSECAFYAQVNDHTQIAANMSERTYEGLIGRYALGWNNSAATQAAVPATPPPPTGKPLSGDFPSSSSIPPVSIMTAEPPVAGTAAAAPAAKPATAAAPKPAAQPAPAAPRKLTPKKPPAPPPPVAPPPPGDDNQ